MKLIVARISHVQSIGLSSWNVTLLILLLQRTLRITGLVCLRCRFSHPTNSQIGQL